MNTVTVQANQSIWDVVAVATGSAEAVWQFCADNGISITDVPAAGTVYVVTAAALAMGDAGVTKYFSNNSTQVGTLGAVAPVLGFASEDLTEEFVTEDGSRVFVSE